MRQFVFVTCSLALTACSFDASSGPSDGRAGDAPSPFDSSTMRDAALVDAPALFTPTHLAAVPMAKLVQTFEVPAGSHDIDTSSAGGLLNLEIVAQAGGGAPLAVAYFDEVTITGDLFVHGTRPLVIVANKITLNGTIDASAFGGEPGPGGSKPGSTDAGNGGKGTSGAGSSTSDSGGGGGGFGSPGGAGGAAGLTAGAAGVADALPNLPRLRGGAAGGAAPRCASAIAGAGGGAVQLSARISVAISGAGAIHAGGGGGTGGGNCSGGLDAGSGGGSGGAIYIEAPTGSIAGGLWANGGAGGAGREFANDMGLNGANGAAALTIALGASSTSNNRDGGNGAAFNGETLVNATAGGPTTNGGGGGGGVGRIVIRGTFISAGSFSPLPASLP